ncbi:hypothetical protein MMC10_009547 [Thelotrema lepadinum]|nr:hypothetical protein [Thelotrema lepadinum]
MSSLVQTPSLLAPSRSSKRGRRHTSHLDDTPKAFKRLMARQEGIRPRSGLDDGNEPSKKKRKLRGNGVKQTDTTHKQLDSSRGYIQQAQSCNSQAAKPPQTPNEISDPSRLDKGVKPPRTRRAKKMMNIRNGWKRAEALRKAQADEAREEAEDQDPCADFWQSMAASSRKGRSERSRGAQDVARQGRISRPSNPNVPGKASAGLIGLHNVVLEPPQLPSLPKTRLLRLKSHSDTGVAGTTKAPSHQESEAWR